MILFYFDLFFLKLLVNSLFSETYLDQQISANMQ